MRRRTAATAGLITLLLIAVGASGAVAALHSTSSTDTSTSDTAAEILSSLGSSRVQSLTESGGVAIVSGTASAQGGEAARTLWYELVAGSSLASIDKLGAVGSKVVDPDGHVLYSSTDDAVEAQNLSASPLSSSDNSKGDIEAVVSKEAPGLGLELLEINYVALYGGTAEVVVHPKNMEGFDDSAMTSLVTLVKPFVQDGRPFLVTFVDDTGAPELVVGHVADIGGTLGQGVAWQAPGVHALLGGPVGLGST